MVDQRLYAGDGSLQGYGNLGGADGGAFAGSGGYGFSANGSNQGGLRQPAYSSLDDARYSNDDRTGPTKFGSKYYPAKLYIKKGEDDDRFCVPMQSSNAQTDMAAGPDTPGLASEQSVARQDYNSSSMER